MLFSEIFSSGIIGLVNLAIFLFVAAFVVGAVVFSIVMIGKTKLSTNKQQDEKLVNRAQWLIDTASDLQIGFVGKSVRVYRCLKCGVVGKGLQCGHSKESKEVETLYYSQKKFCSMLGHQYVDRAQLESTRNDKGEWYADVMRECEICGYKTWFKKFYNAGRGGEEIVEGIVVIGLSAIIFLILSPIIIPISLFVKAFDKEPQIHYREI